MAGFERSRADLLCGAAALALVVQKLISDQAAGIIANNLWLCHLGNLAMGLGLLLGLPRLARIGALWLLPGVPVWLIDAVLAGTTTLPSAVSHLGGLLVAGWVVWRTEFRASDGFIGWLGFLLVQQACRWWTPPSLNVNLAHAIYPGSERFFPSYAVYAVVIAAAVAVVLTISNIGLRAWQRHGSTLFLQRAIR